MKLQEYISEVNKDMEEINRLAELLEQKQSLLVKYNIKIEFSTI